MVIEKLFEDFFKGKTILITGHTGFMGSWLSIWLKELGAEIIGYALPPYTKEDNYVVTKLDEKITSIIGDVRDFENLKSVFNKYKPEIIFHLAAQSLVRKSYGVPKETFDINVGGTVNIFESFRLEEKCKILINITTDKCYENKESIEGYSEEDRLGGYDPYSSSKASSELVTSAYKNSYFNDFSSKNLKIVSSLRSGNIIGGGDWREDRLIPDCIRAIKNNVPIIIRNPNAIRPWQLVLEPLRGYLMLAKKMWEGDGKFSGAWNFGSDPDYLFSVEDIVKKVIKFTGKGSYSIQSKENSDTLHETEFLVLNCKKSNDILGWNSVLNIDETIDFICEWYFGKKVDYDFDVNQIKKYISKVNN